MKWREMMHEMTCDDAMHAMQIVYFGYMQWDATLNFWFRLHATRCNLEFLIMIVDCDHNLIILFLISLRIWSIGVDVKLTQQDVKNPHLQVVYGLTLTCLSLVLGVSFYINFLVSHKHRCSKFLIKSRIIWSNYDHNQ